MKRFSSLLLCLLLAASFCACTSSSPAASSETPVTSLPASSAEAPSSALPAPSEAAEKLELEIDRTLGLDTLAEGRYINSNAELVSDKTYFEKYNDPSSYEDFCNMYGVTKGISTALLGWEGVLADGKTYFSNDLIGGMQPTDLDEKHTDTVPVESRKIWSSWSDIIRFTPYNVMGSGDLPYAFSKSEYISMAFASDGITLIPITEKLPEKIADCTFVDGRLWIHPDKTLSFYFECNSSHENLGEPDFSKYHDVVSAAFQSYTLWGYQLLKSDGTLLFADGKGTERLLAENTVYLTYGLSINSSNEVFRHLIQGESVDSLAFEKIGTVSDWHNVAYLKQLNGDTVVAAMKNGTVEVVSPGDASKTLLDFLASIKDLKVAWE